MATRLRGHCGCIRYSKWIESCFSSTYPVFPSTTVLTWFFYISHLVFCFTTVLTWFFYISLLILQHGIDLVHPQVNTLVEEKTGYVEDKQDSIHFEYHNA